jgi:hypothetical protein
VLSLGPARAFGRGHSFTGVVIGRGKNKVAGLNATAWSLTSNYFLLMRPAPMTSSTTDETLELMGLEVLSPVSPSPLLWDLLRRLVSTPIDQPIQQLKAFAAEAAAAREFPLALLAGMHAIRLSYESEALEEARNSGVLTLQLARETGNVLAEAHAYRLLALIAFDEGRSKDGHDHLLDAMAAFEDAGRQGEVPTLTRWYAEHLAVLGAIEESVQAFTLARERFLDVGDAAGARLCELDLAAARSR